MSTSEYIKEKLKEFNTKSKKTNLFNPNLQRTSSRYFILKMNDRDIIRVFDFGDRIVIEINIKASILFAVNLPDTICLANKALRNNAGFKIYTSNTIDKTILDCIDLIKQDLVALNLQSNEGMYVYGNGISLNINITRDLIPEIKVLQTLKSIIEDNFPEAQDLVDPQKLPEDLRSLIPLFSEWAIMDDLERKEKLQKSSKTKLKKVMEFVYPKMNEINGYLDSFKDNPLPNEAILIGRLAELVSELKKHHYYR